MTAVEVTLFAKAGGPLSKTIALVDGQLKSDSSSCKMAAGTAERWSCRDIGDLAHAIGKFKPNEALALGRLRPDLPGNVRITTRAKVNGATNVIARTGENIVFAPGEPALALLDFDVKGMPADVAERLAGIGGFEAALIAVVPEIAVTARMLRASTSAGIFRSDTGERFASSGGVHGYLMVQDGADVERFLKTLHARAWLAGFGWYIVGAAGQMLERSIIDVSVFSPERLVFEGPAVLTPPLAQDGAARRPVVTDGRALDTVTACVPLTLVENNRLVQLQARAAAALAEAADGARRAFVERLIARTNMSPEAARRVVERQLSGVLLPAAKLVFDDADIGTKTVGDVLNDPDRYAGETLADPIEGVEYGTGKAKILRRGDGVVVRSLAHGKVVSYVLRYDLEAAKAAIEAALHGAVPSVFVAVVMAGELAVDEVMVLRDLAAQRGGIKPAPLDAKLKAARGEARRHQAKRNRQRDLDAVAVLVAEFNAKYAVVNEAGQAVIYQRDRDPVRDRMMLTRINFADLQKMYLNRQLSVTRGDGTVETRSAADLWLAHPERRQYLGGVVFDPTSKAPADCWNLWSGFAVEPEPGDWSLMKDHIERVVCAGNAEHLEYVLNWCARLVQHPEQRGEVAIVLRGDKGAGKGVFCGALKRLFGQHGLQITNALHLVGNFNAHLRDCVLLFADEAFFAGDRQHEGVLKALVTEEVLPIEAKYQNLVEVPNLLHILMASNSEWVVPASHDERRYFVLDVADHRRGDFGYFAEIAAQMANGGAAAMLHELLRRDIAGFNVRAMPGSAALTDQKKLSLDTLDRWWLDVLSRGFLWRSKYGARAFAAWTEFAATELLWRSYKQWCGENRVNRVMPRELLGRRLHRFYGCERPRGTVIIGEVEALVYPDKEERIGAWLDEFAVVRSDVRPPGYRLGGLDEARRAFTFGRDIVGEWQTDVEPGQG